MLWVKPHEFKDIHENTTGVYQRLSKREETASRIFSSFISFIYSVTLKYITCLFRIPPAAVWCFRSSGLHEGTLGNSLPEIKRSSNNFTTHRVRAKQEQRPQNKAGSHQGTRRDVVQRQTPLGPLSVQEHRRQRRDTAETTVFKSQFASP